MFSSSLQRELTQSFISGRKCYLLNIYHKQVKKALKIISSFTLNTIKRYFFTFYTIKKEKTINTSTWSNAQKVWF